MSDQATTEAATEATVAPATEAPAQVQEPQVAEQEAPQPTVSETPDAEGQQPEPTGRVRKQDARRQWREERQKKREQAEAAEAAEGEAGPKVDAKGNLHSPEDGKFVEKPEAEAEGEDGQDEQVPEGEGETAVAEGEATPEGDEEAASEQPAARRIPLPEGHPLRDQGIEFFEATDEQQEQGIRALVNSYTRRQEVEARDQKIREMDAKLAELQQQITRQKATEGTLQEWQKTPEYQQAVATYESILNAEGQEAASTYWDGIQGKLRETIDEKYEQDWSEIEEQRNAEAAEVWTNHAYEQIGGKLDPSITSMPGYNQWFGQAVAQLDTEILNGLHGHIQPGDTDGMMGVLKDVLDSLLLRQPEIQQLVRERQAAEKQQSKAKSRQEIIDAQKQAQQKREAENAKEQAVTDFKKEAADKRLKSPPHPLGQLSDANRGDEALVGAGADGDDPLAGLTGHALKRAARRGARADAKRRIGS